MFTHSCQLFEGGEWLNQAAKKILYPRKITALFKQRAPHQLAYGRNKKRPVSGQGDSRGGAAGPSRVSPPGRLQGQFSERATGGSEDQRRQFDSCARPGHTNRPGHTEPVSANPITKARSPHPETQRSLIRKERAGTPPFGYPARQLGQAVG